MTNSDLLHGRPFGARCGLAAAAVLCALHVGDAIADEPAAPPAGAAQDESGVDARLAGLRAGVCASDESLCRHLKAFTAGIAPCFPQGERLTVGHAFLVRDDASVEPSEYFAIRSQRVRDVTLIQSQHVYSENEEEKQAAEELVQAVKAGAIDESNALYKYLEQRSSEVPQLLAQSEARGLVVRSEGPALFLRQSGKLLYAAMPDATVTMAGRPQGRRGLVFAVLPAPASCQ